MTGITEKENYVTVFIGSEYSFPHHMTVGELRWGLEKIIKNLPVNEDSSEITISLHENTLTYDLDEGIPTD